MVQVKEAGLADRLIYDDTSVAAVSSGSCRGRLRGDWGAGGPWRAATSSTAVPARRIYGAQAVLVRDSPVRVDGATVPIRAVTVLGLGGAVRPDVRAAGQYRESRRPSDRDSCRARFAITMLGGGPATRGLVGGRRQAHEPRRHGGGLERRSCCSGQRLDRVELSTEIDPAADDWHAPIETCRTPRRLRAVYQGSALLLLLAVHLRPAKGSLLPCATPRRSQWIVRYPTARPRQPS